MGYNPIRVSTCTCPALPCLSRRPANHAPPCSACRAALLAARCPALPVAPPRWWRAALPCLTRRPAGRRVALPCPRAALLATAPPYSACASPCPARALHCWLLRQPALHARCPALPARHPAGRRPATCATLLRAALLPALPCYCPPCCAQPCWPPPCPALVARRSSLAGRRLALPCALP
ncbi:unnamed protein product [Closterium sp. NIES-53]